jgi:hypothetical protein
VKDRPILLLATAQTLIWACLYYSFPALLLHWEQALGWSRADLTAAITLAVFVSAICSPLYGRLIDAGKGAVMMTTAAILGGFCLLLLTQVEYRWQFYLVWGVVGVCMAGSLYEPCFALITRARGEHAKRAIIMVTLIDLVRPDRDPGGGADHVVRCKRGGARRKRAPYCRYLSFHDTAIISLFAGVLVSCNRIWPYRADARDHLAPFVADSR